MALICAPPKRPANRSPGLADADRWREGPLQDGTVGYLVRFPRNDDCFAAAVATTLQVPIDDVPDPRLHERWRAGEDPERVSRSGWAEFDRWLTRRGLRMLTHRKVPVARARWIGVVPMSGLFNDHCLVMARDEVLFDPTLDFKFVALAKILSSSDLERIRRIHPRLWGPTDVGYGLSFQKVSRPAAATRRS